MKLLRLLPWYPLYLVLYGGRIINTVLKPVFNFRQAGKSNEFSISQKLSNGSLENEKLDQSRLRNLPALC